MIYRIIVFLVITFVVILIFCIISIVISKRNYKRLIKSQMEVKIWRQYQRSSENLIIGRGYTRTVNLDDERSLKPYKHIKRHSIR